MMKPSPKKQACPGRSWLTWEV